ncbi:MAG: geranylgeranylglyceryl/heptaprenylglyceryl phosphate synthase [Chitinophagales bacterium]|jgi:putative glycerol-1-phosphate prenyltransferase|nr:geranylgeranylglyceryl/heptaprenylglyceryl phosphate synthase [Chitinophagales bacterium]
MNEQVYIKLKQAKLNRQKLFAVLVDPDRVSPESLICLIEMSSKAHVDFFFIGSSLLVNDTINECIDVIKSCCDIPAVIFPGSSMQIYAQADAVLLLSLISGRNADLLIGQHVIAAPSLKASGLEIVSTGYILIDGGNATTVSYISNTIPIPNDKDEVAMCTAMAGEMLGLNVIYLDAGSGALHCVSESMVEMVSASIEVPLLVGGGIQCPEKAASLCKAGADIIVVGNAVEKDPLLLFSISRAVHAAVII